MGIYKNVCQESVNNSLRINDSREVNGETVGLYYPESKGEQYRMSSLLSFEYEGEWITQSMYDWYMQDPIFLEEQRTAIGFYVTQASIKRIYHRLFNSVKKENLDYLKRKMGLRFLIEFQGYSDLVSARVPYEVDPVSFYRWWVRDKSKVHMSKVEQIVLFQKVYLMDQSILQKGHLKALGLSA